MSNNTTFGKYNLDEGKFTDLPMNEKEEEDSEEDDNDKNNLFSMDEQNRQPLLNKKSKSAKFAGKTTKNNNQNYQSLQTEDMRETELNNDSDNYSEDEEDDEQIVIKKSFLRRKLRIKDNKKRKLNNFSVDDDDLFDDLDHNLKSDKKNRKLRFFGLKKDRKRYLDNSKDDSKTVTLMPNSNRDKFKNRLETDRSFDSSDSCLLNEMGDTSFNKIKILIPRHRQKTRFWRFKLKMCLKNCCGRLTLLLFILGLVLLLLSWKRIELDELVSNRLINSWSEYTHRRSVKKLLNIDLQKCDLQSINIWNVTHPELTIESAIRTIDVNQDGIMDIVVGFGTGIDMAKYSQVACQIYFNHTKNDLRGCGGGVMVLDGKNGQTLWKSYTLHEILAINCELMIDEDKIPDCLVAGRMAGMYAFSGINGHLIWKINPTQGDPIIFNSNFYTPLLLPIDVDEDGSNDIIVMHGGDPLRRPTDSAHQAARLIVLSSKTGQILRWSLVPDSGESYYSPQILYRKDSHLKKRPYLLYGTGSETHRGSLFIVPLDELLLRNSLSNSVSLYQDCCKGIIAPAVLVDLNEDSILDIILPAFNSTMIAIDGQSLRQLWRTKFADSETYATPAPAYFNHDHVPDFLVQYQHGPGFPVYYYSQLQVLDGRDGRPLLNQSIKMLIGSHSSPLTLSIKEIDSPITNGDAQQTEHVRSFGNDMYIYWHSTCDHSGINLDTSDSTDQSIAFKLRYANTYEATRADYCKLRFGKQIRNRLQALAYNQNAITLYDSNNPNVKKIEIAFQRNYSEISQTFLRNHPEYSDQPIDLSSNAMDIASKSAYDPSVNMFNSPSSYLNSNNDDKNLLTKYKNKFVYPSLIKPDSGQIIQPMMPMSAMSQIPQMPTFVQAAPLQANPSIPVQLPVYNQPSDSIHFERDLDHDFFSNSHGHFGPEIESEDNFDRLQRRPESILQRLDELTRNQRTNLNPNEFGDSFEPSARRKRRRRQVQNTKMPTERGLQRITSTGTLTRSEQSDSIDLVFATYWIPASKKVKLVTKKMQSCLDFYMKPEVERIRFNPNSNLAGYDHASYGDYISDLCEQIIKSKSQPTTASVPPRNSYTPFNIQMGSLTIYRKRLSCHNNKLKPATYSRQLWPSYLGLHANSIANL